MKQTIKNLSEISKYLRKSNADCIADEIDKQIIKLRQIKKIRNKIQHIEIDEDSKCICGNYLNSKNLCGIANFCPFCGLEIKWEKKDIDKLI